MYRDLKNIVKVKFDFVKTILLSWKDTIRISDEDKERLFLYVIKALDIDCSKEFLDLPTVNLINLAKENDCNSIYTLYMATCDNVFKFISMMLDEDITAVENVFVETYVYGFINISTYDYMETLEKWFKKIAIEIMKNNTEK